MRLRIGVVLNDSAGSCNDRSLRGRIQESLGSGADVSIHSAPGGAELRAAATRYIQEGCNVLVAGGGDGTVSSLASLLVGSGIALGVLPLGTLNHFARDLGIPSDLDRASRVILAGHSTMVDIGE